jgi:hypothetical protein
LNPDADVPAVPQPQVHAIAILMATMRTVGLQLVDALRTRRYRFGNDGLTGEDEPGRLAPLLGER